jgi:hypothetical protein
MSTKTPATVFCKYMGDTVGCALSVAFYSKTVLSFLLPSFPLLLSSDISNCEVVTAWAEGCSWSEALEISGSPPGDLARILSRVLDATRQFGNLPFSPMRRSDMEGSTSSVETVSRGIHPEVRRLCRDAAKAINRYPVKDPLVFASDDDDEAFDKEQLDDTLDFDDDDDDSNVDQTDDENDSNVDQTDDDNDSNVDQADDTEAI